MTLRQIDEFMSNHEGHIKDDIETPWTRPVHRYTLWELPIYQFTTQHEDSQIEQWNQIAVDWAKEKEANGRELDMLNPGQLKDSLHTNEELKDLTYWFLCCAKAAAKEANMNYWMQVGKDPYVKMKDMWSWSGKNYSTPLHGHTNSSWSGIYYSDPGDTNGTGDTTFHSPLPHSIYTDPGNEFLDRASVVTFTPEPRTLILFPSILKHEAQYNSDKDRTIIAFNVRFTW